MPGAPRLKSPKPVTRALPRAEQPIELRRELPELASDLPLALNGQQTISCICCETPLQDPLHAPPLGATPVMVGGVEVSNLLGATKATCQCCAMEVHNPTLAKHLEDRRVLVFAWEGLPPPTSPRQLLGWLRLVYGFLARLDESMKGDPGYHPLLHDPLFVPTALDTTIRQELDYAFNPVWNAPQSFRAQIARIGQDLRLPRLPDPSATYQASLGLPSASAWMGPAWATIVRENPTFWRTFRQNLLLIPAASIAHNPLWDARNQIMECVPDFEEPTLQILKLAHIV